MEKKFDFKKFLSNNAIIILIILLALFVGCTTQNFFTETNGKNLLLNVAPRFIIACGVSGCLITKGTDLSAGRQVGRAGQAARSAANDENLHPLVHTDQRLSPDNDPLGASNPCVLLAFINPIR